MSDAETSAEVAKAGKGIKKAFRKVSCFAMPGPGAKVQIGSEENAKTASAQMTKLCVSGQIIWIGFLFPLLFVS